MRNKTINLKDKQIHPARPARPVRRVWPVKQILVIACSIIITAAGIKAADNVLDKPEEIAVSGNCPAGMTQVLSAGGNFCIDIYEASAGEKCPSANPGTQSDTRENINKINCLPVSRKGAPPWKNISQNQAATACVKAGKRLPTNEEWLAAAQGTPDSASNWTEDDCQINKNWASQPGLTGSGKNCISAAGAYDMIGNVWEWVEGTVYNGEYQNKKLPEQGYVSAVDQAAMPSATKSRPDENYNEDYLFIKDIGTRGISRGGYWNNKNEAGQYSAYIVNEPSYAGEGTGFRCVK